MWREISGGRYGCRRTRTKQISVIRNSPAALGAARLMFLELESHEKLIGTKAKSSQKEEIGTTI